ncbi:MAG TPA: energy transducer TonB [Bryobacteraceae bacterium]|nr:energy transducer TonB [Bryobacteraceae bacterium]
MEHEDVESAVCDVSIPERDYASWQHPLRNTQIRMHPAPLRALSAEALHCLKSKQPSEIGGLLWGKFPAEPGNDSMLIAEAELVPCQGPLYNRTPEDARSLEFAITRQRPESGLQLIGYFRSHIREGLCLSPQDQSLIERCLRRPEYIFLLIRPFEMGICVGGFFFWQNGILQTDGSDLEVPFVSLDPAHSRTDEPYAGPDERPVPIMPPAPRQEPPLAEIPRHPVVAPQPERRTWFFLTRFAATLTLAAAAGASAYFMVPAIKSRLPVTNESASSEVHLRVLRASDGQLDVTWDRNALERSGAQSGLLTIRDGPISKNLAIDRDQLRSGTLTYFPNGGDVQFRLEVSLDGGRSFVGSVRVLLPQSNASNAPVALPSEEAVQMPPAQAKAAAGTKPPQFVEKNRPVRVAHQRFRAPAYIPFSNSVLPSSTTQVRPPAPDLRIDAALSAFAASAPSVASLFSPPPQFPLRPPPAAVPPNLPVEKPSKLEPIQPTAASTKTPSSFIPPHPLKQVMPDIKLAGNALALQAGKVEVQVTVDESGRVKDARPVRKDKAVNSLVASAAINAARQWIFQPARLHGKAIPAQHLIVFEFRSENR